MEAVLLLAGKGVRIRPFIGELPKPLVKIVDKPLLNYSLEKLLENGVRRIIAVVGYASDLIQSYLNILARNLNFEIKIVKQKNLLGTGDALKLVYNLIENDFFLTIYGDLYFDDTVLRRLFYAFNKRKSTYMVVVRKSDVSQYGLVKLKDSQVKEIIEKPSEQFTSGYVNAGIYLFDKSIFDYLDSIMPSERGEYEITDAINLLASERTLLSIKISERRWIDVGRPWDLLDANIMELKNRSLYECRYIKRISNGVLVIPPVYISENAIIENNSVIGPYTVIGDSCFIGQGSIIENTVIMDHVSVGRMVKLKYSLIGSKSIIEDHVETKCLLRKEKIVKIDDRTLKLKPRRIGCMISCEKRIEKGEILEAGFIV